MSRLNDDAKSSVNTTSLSNASDIIHATSLPNATPITNYQSPITHWVPKSKPRLCLFAFGKAEVRVAFNDRAERYHSRNLVTERDVTERASIMFSAISIHSSPIA